MRLSEIETPALVVDLDIFERNLARVGGYAREHGLRLRPHTKTHKSPAVGRKQLESGAAGLTVAKVGEAEVMLRSGTPDLLVAYPVIGRGKLARLMEVARHTQVTVALDSLCAAQQLSEAAQASGVTVAVLAETDVGLGRVGVKPGPDLLALARGIQGLPRLTFAGITFYPGHIKDNDDHGRQQMVELSRTVDAILGDFRAAGLEVNIVSGGSTPTLYHSHEIAGLSEIRPGTYVYNDVNTVMSGGCAWEDCAASLVVTVVSTARPGQIIVDGGSKTFSSDRIAGPGEVTFGRVMEIPAAAFRKMNEEHGYIDVTAVDHGFSIGDRLQIIPNHICVAVNLHERVYGVRNGEVEEVWDVEGRGKLQ